MALVAGSPFTQVPVLETERLRLRGHCSADFEAAAAMWADPEVTRYIGGKPFTAEETWSKLLRYAGHWAWLGFGYWVIEEKTTGAFVGEAGFADFKRGLQPPLGDMPEAGWVLASHKRGQGYATEATAAALAWGDANFSGAQTACLIHPENQASIRVAEKCGYRKLRMTSYKGHPAMILVR